MFSRGKSASHGIPRIGNATSKATSRVAAVHGLSRAFGARASQAGAPGSGEAARLTVAANAVSPVVAYFVGELAGGLAIAGDLGKAQIVRLVGPE